MTDTILTAPEAPAAASAAAPVPPSPPSPEGTTPEAPPVPEQGQEPPAPPDYSALSVPEGVAIDSTILDSFKSLAGEQGLSAEGAQKLMNLHMQTVQAQQAAHQQMISDWSNSVAQDPEIGGAHQAHALGLAKQALSAFGSPGLIEALNQSGLGNHPELIRAFYRMGKATAEDGRKEHGNSSVVDPLRALYPSMYP